MSFILLFVYVFEWQRGGCEGVGVGGILHMLVSPDLMPWTNSLR